MTERATLRTVDGAPVLRFERRLRHPPEKVWRAVTDPAEMTHWFPAAVEAELRPGAPMRITFPDEAVVEGASDGEVLEVDPPKVYMFRWKLDVLRFELIPDGDGCRLVFTHTLGGGWAARLGAARNAAGWDTCLDAMIARLDGTTAPEHEGWLAPIERYVDAFGLGFGTVRRVGDGFELHFARDMVWKPPADVWQELVEDEPLTTEPPMRATNGDDIPPGRLLSADPPHELTYEWLLDGAPAGTVRWSIASDLELGVRVELTQTVPAAAADRLARILATWHVHLESFFAVTHGEIRCPWPYERADELAKRYADELA